MLPFTSIDRYVARLMFVPLSATLALTAVLLLIDKMRRLFDFVIQNGGPIGIVWKMLATTLPEYLSLGIPIGLLLGTSLAFRKLATSSELDILRAIGISYGRLLKVPMIYALVLGVLNLFVLFYVQPFSQYTYEGLRYELRTGALGAAIKNGEFNQIGKKITLRIEGSRDGGKVLHGIFFRALGRNGADITATAETGSFLATEDRDTIVFRLINGNLVSSSPKFATPRVLTFSNHDLPIDLPKDENFRKRGFERVKELTGLELAVGAGSHHISVRREASAELSFRLVQVAIMGIIPFLGLALGIPPKRSSSFLGIFLSIVMIVTYYKINQWGADVAALGKISPLFSLWTPFVGFSSLCMWMYYNIAAKPGGQPIGFLERGFSLISRFFSRLVTRSKMEAQKDGF